MCLLKLEIYDQYINGFLLTHRLFLTCSFHLRSGQKACTDPALEWVMTYINRIR